MTGEFFLNTVNIHRAHRCNTQGSYWGECNSAKNVFNVSPKSNVLRLAVTSLSKHQIPVSEVIPPQWFQVKLVTHARTESHTIRNTRPPPPTTEAQSKAKLTGAACHLYVWPSQKPCARVGLGWFPPEWAVFWVALMRSCWRSLPLLLPSLPPPLPLCSQTELIYDTVAVWFWNVCVHLPPQTFLPPLTHIHTYTHHPIEIISIWPDMCVSRAVCYWYSCWLSTYKRNLQHLLSDIDIHSKLK